MGDWEEQRIVLEGLGTSRPWQGKGGPQLQSPCIRDHPDAHLGTYRLSSPLGRVLITLTILSLFAQARKSEFGVPPGK